MKTTKTARPMKREDDRAESGSVVALSLWSNRCKGGCGTAVLDRGAGRLAHCGACWFATDTCRREGVRNLAEMRKLRADRDALMARLTALVRESATDAAALIREMRRLL